MNWKEFLKPDWKKILVLLILLLLTGFFLKGLSLSPVNKSFGPWNVAGWPFTYLYKISHFMGGTVPIDQGALSPGFVIGTLIIQKSPTQIVGLNIPLFLLDMVLWYPVSCMVINLYNRAKKK